MLFTLSFFCRNRVDTLLFQIKFKFYIFLYLRVGFRRGTEPGMPPITVMRFEQSYFFFYQTKIMVSSL